MNDSITLWDGRTYDRELVMSMCPALVERAEACPSYIEQVAIGNDDDMPLSSLILWPLLACFLVAFIGRRVASLPSEPISNMLAEAGLWAAVLCLSFIVDRHRKIRYVTVEIANGRLHESRGKHTSSIVLSDIKWQRGSTWDDSQTAGWSNLPCVLVVGRLGWHTSGLGLGVNEQDREILIAFFRLAGVGRLKDRHPRELLYAPLIALGCIAVATLLGDGVMLLWGVDVLTMGISMAVFVLATAWGLPFAEWLMGNPYMSLYFGGVGGRVMQDDFDGGPGGPEAGPQG